MARTRTLIVAAITAAALVGAGAAVATSAANAGGPGAPADSLDVLALDTVLGATDDDPGMSDRMRPGHRFGHRGADRMLHGEVVVRGKDDTPVTVAVQRGEVTAVDDESVTVRSEDGFERTWTLDDETRYRSLRGAASQEGVTVGTTVRLAGPVTDGTATARIVGIPPEDGASTGGAQGGAEGGTDGPASTSAA